MRKRFTKIICTAVAAISALSLAVAPACKKEWESGLSMDGSAANVTSNGGFLVQTGDYVYFINGKANSTDSNTFGEVVKGSIQRIKKTDVENKNYSNTETVVPSVIYSGTYNAGIYIYGDYIYYTTPSSQKNTDGEVINSNLDFKRTKLDGTDTTEEYIWQSDDNGLDYRYVKADGNVYIIYARSENLYGTTTTNIHSVNCSTGDNTLLAYQVKDYAFDTEDPENPYIYYTMGIPAEFDGNNIKYNQLFRVRADAVAIPLGYDVSGADGYDAESNPVYVNRGDFVFDGIGITRYGSENGYTQFNYGYPDGKEAHTVTNDDYQYDIQWYKNGELYYTRKEGNDTASLYKLTNADLPTDGNGRVESSWDAIDENNNAKLFINGGDTTSYTFVTINETPYAISTGSDGIIRREVEEGKLSEDKLVMSTDSSATVLGLKDDNGHKYLYYSVTGGNGYTVNRLAIDGTKDDYKKYPQNGERDPEFVSVRVLDLDACSGWYKPEFVGNTLFFASENEGMENFNYIMACDMSNESGNMMGNAELKELREQYTAVTDKIEEYDEKTNSDGNEKAYENLTSALKYQFYTRDSEYVETLIKAYQDVLGKERNYLYSEESIQIYKDFATLSGDWAEDEDGNAYKSTTVNGETVHSNTRDYYYSIVGKMSEEDREGYLNTFKASETYFKPLPVDERTWWQKMSKGAQAGFVIGIVCAGLTVLGFAGVLVLYLVTRRKNRQEQEGGKSKIKVDITDDRDMDVYGDGNE